MSKSSKLVKYLVLYCVLSLVVILAGAVMFGLKGFNVAQQAGYKVIAVKYDSYVTLSETLENRLRENCEAKVEEAGISISYAMTSDATDGGMLEIVVSADTEDASIEGAIAAIRSYLTSDADLSNGDFAVAAHNVLNETMLTYLWRAAIPAGVFVLVAFVYAAIRYRLSMAFAGLAVQLHNLLLLVALAALCRIPVGEPFITASLFVLVFTTLLAYVLFDAFKRDFASASFAGKKAAEAVGESLANSRRKVLVFLIVTGLAVLAVGAIAAQGTMIAMIPAFIAVLLCAYSTLCVLPALYARFKAVTDQKDAVKNHYANRK